MKVAMPAFGMTRETRIGLFAFAVLSVAASFNLFFLQGHRINNSVETSAILRPDVGKALGTSADAGLGTEAAPADALIVSPPQLAARPLPVASAPPPSFSRGDVTRAIQRGLAAQGYEPGTPDGIMGLMTKAAIMAYEADNGLALTGEPSDELMRRIEGGPRPAAASRKGASEVKTLEAATLIRNTGQWLAAIGYPVSKSETSMSPSLVRAIRDYEASQKMPETGRISAPLVARLSRAGQNRAVAK